MTTSNKRIMENCLALKYPDLLEQWHPTKNRPLTPFDVTPGSNEKVFWKCPKGDDHEWNATIYSRVKGNKCPVCSNKKITKSNCLKTTHPELAAEWHTEKNGDLTPEDVVAGSGKTVFWKCPKGNDHIWKMPIQKRLYGRGCPVCTNRTVMKSNSLAVTHPELAVEWHAEKNGDLTPEDVVAGSSKIVFWKCQKGDDHVWNTSLKNRKNGSGCPVCEGLKATMSTCLKTTHPKLAADWHAEKNGDLTPEDVVAGSNKIVFWKCPKGEDHVWEAVIFNRVKGSGCPVCCRQKATKSNCLATTHPEIANEWHPTKNDNLTPYEVVPLCQPSCRL